MRKRVSERIGMVRRFRGVSQIEAAAAIDREQQTWSAIEHGRTSIDVDTLDSIARYFKVPFEFFVREELHLEEMGAGGLPKPERAATAQSKRKVA